MLSLFILFIQCMWYSACFNITSICMLMSIMHVHKFSLPFFFPNVLVFAVPSVQNKIYIFVIREYIFKVPWVVLKQRDHCICELYSLCLEHFWRLQEFRCCTQIINIRYKHRYFRNDVTAAISSLRKTNRNMVINTSKSMYDRTQKLGPSSGLNSEQYGTGQLVIK